MADRPVFLYAAVYQEIADAEADYEAVFELHAAGAIGTFDSAVIRKEADGKGALANAIRYPTTPTNFKEPGTIAQLPISYVYWRVREGGIADKQFKSAMPGWGDELSEDELWKVIMYAYDKAGVKPRTWE